MTIFAYAIEGLAVFLSISMEIYYWLILLRALISWFSPDPYNPLVQFLVRVTEPVLEPFRRILMPLTYAIRVDLSALVALLLIHYSRRYVIITLFHFAEMLK